VRARPAGDEVPSGGLRIRDAEAAAAVVPSVLAVAPVREASLSAEMGGRHASATVVGTTAAYQSAARLSLAAGRFLADLDLRERKRVAVLGAGIARQLTLVGDPLGEPVRLGGDWYTVVGLLEDRAAPRAKALPIRARDVNGAVFVPLPALDRGAGKDAETIDELVLRVQDAEQVTSAAEAMTRLLRRTTGGATLEVLVPREILRQRERTQRIFNVVTGAVAAIGLLVGGIGIMNIMLASVAERTAEIGVRRALGASRRDIAAQFLVESSLLTAVGGVVGVLLGIVSAGLIQHFAEWRTALSPPMLLLALLMAGAVGVGFGFYPAWHAARLEPMEALRRG
jgi:putative ABC transport system permease protein